MQDYRKLRVWESALALAIEVRGVSDQFPRNGYAELRAQMTSAAESIANNIVEGCGSATSKEFARYLSIAIKSASELEGELQLAQAYKVISPTGWSALSSATTSLRKQLYVLRSRVLNPRATKSPATPNPKP